MIKDLSFKDVSFTVHNVQENDTNTVVKGAISGNGITEGRFQVTGDDSLNDFKPGKTYAFNLDTGPILSASVNSSAESAGTQPNNTTAVAPTSSMEADHTGAMPDDINSKETPTITPQQNEPSSDEGEKVKSVGDKHGV